MRDDNGSNYTGGNLGLAICELHEGIFKAEIYVSSDRVAARLNGIPKAYLSREHDLSEKEITAHGSHSGIFSECAHPRLSVQSTRPPGRRRSVKET
jgi:hypothetical protein